MYCLTHHHLIARAIRAKKNPDHLSMIRVRLVRRKVTSSLPWASPWAWVIPSLLVLVSLASWMRSTLQSSDDKL